MPVSSQLHAWPPLPPLSLPARNPRHLFKRLGGPRVCLTVPGIKSRLVQPITQSLYRTRYPRSSFLSYVISDETKQYSFYLNL